MPTKEYWRTRHQVERERGWLAGRQDRAVYHRRFGQPPETMPNFSGIASMWFGLRETASYDDTPGAQPPDFLGTEHFATGYGLGFSGKLPGKVV